MALQQLSDFQCEIWCVNSFDNLDCDTNEKDKLWVMALKRPLDVWLIFEVR